MMVFSDEGVAKNEKVENVNGRKGVKGEWEKGRKGERVNGRMGEVTVFP